MDSACHLSTIAIEEEGQDTAEKSNGTSDEAGKEVRVFSE